MPFKPVSGIGPINSSIMIVGEAPGQDESVIEEPFVGQAGRMLDVLLKDSGINRQKTFICNTVNCRPTNDGKKNRPPSKTEINSCKHWLLKQIDLVKPKLIFTLGKIPTHVLLSLKPSFKLADYLGQPVKYIQNEVEYIIVPNYHPSYIMQYGKKEVNTAIEIFKKGLEHAQINGL
jgi:DNA polymerase